MFPTGNIINSYGAVLSGAAPFFSGGAPVNTILEDRIQLDLIERLERVRDILEEMSTSEMADS